MVIWKLLDTMKKINIDQCQNLTPKYILYVYHQAHKPLRANIHKHMHNRLLACLFARYLILMATKLEPTTLKFYKIFCARSRGERDMTTTPYTFAQPIFRRFSLPHSVISSHFFSLPHSCWIKRERERERERFMPTAEVRQCNLDEMPIQDENMYIFQRKNCVSTGEEKRGRQQQKPPPRTHTNIL